MNKIIQTTLDFWQSGRKIRRSPSGWLSGNAVCCAHRGESQDRRGRAGVILSTNGISWHCFNCGFKTGYTEGHPLGLKFRKLLSWLGVESIEIDVLKLEALRYDQVDSYDIIPKPKVQLVERELPFGSKLLSENSNEFIDHTNYIKKRGFELDEFPFLVTHDPAYSMHRRIILPFSFDNKIVGFTGRLIQDGKPKYYSQHDPTYVFGLDSVGQVDEQSWVTVTEGPFDALCLNGVAVLGAEVRDEQADQIDYLNRKIIVVPDRNSPGMSYDKNTPNSLINTAIDYGWYVSFPDWENDVIDVNQAVQRYGRLYVVRTMLDAITLNPTSIKLRARKYK